MAQSGVWGRGAGTWEERVAQGQGGGEGEGSIEILHSKNQLMAMRLSAAVLHGPRGDHPYIYTLSPGPLAP